MAVDDDGYTAECFPCEWTRRHPGNNDGAHCWVTWLADGAGFVVDDLGEVDDQDEVVEWRCVNALEGDSGTRL